MTALDNESPKPYFASAASCGLHNEVVVNRSKTLSIWCGIIAIQAVLHGAVFLSWNPSALLGREYRGTVMCLIPLLSSALTLMLARRLGVLMAIGGCIVSFLFGLVHWLVIILIVAQAI